MDIHATLPAWNFMHLLPRMRTPLGASLTKSEQSSLDSVDPLQNSPSPSALLSTRSVAA